jgi:hypothetical protein
MQKLSSFNIIFAVIYVLIYLKSGTFNSTSGILAIIVFNWLGLRSFQLDNYHWGIWHYLTGGWILYFIGTLVYGAINILSASLEFNFISNDALVNLILTFIFCVLVMVHFGMYLRRNYMEKP